MLSRLISDFRQLRFALERHYRKRHRRPLSPVQEAERDIARMRREQQALRRLSGLR